jgi:hypothetical protein
MQTRIVPERYIQFQIDTILRGLGAPPAPQRGRKGLS